MNFKNYFRLIQESKTQLVEEGGLGGHMKHVYEALSPEEVFTFFDELLNGNLELSEKVDGTNLFVGMEMKGNTPITVFARNTTEAPSADISSKFPESHPAHDAFTAGFAAIKQKFESLSKEKLVQYKLLKYEDNTFKPNYFINLEIMYGEVPNIIQYSDNKNYIKFHAYNKGPNNNWESGSADGDDAILEKLANEGDNPVTINSPVVGWAGDIDGELERVVSNEDSTWQFVGNIIFDKSKITNELEQTAKEWKSFPQAKAVAELLEIEDRTEEQNEELFEKLKLLTDKISSEVLSKVVSALYDAETVKTPEGHPRVEGLVIRGYNNEPFIKITGDFRLANDNLWQVLRGTEGDGLPDHKNNTVLYVLNEVLKIPLKGITKRSWEAKGVDGDPREFLIKKAKPASTYKTNEVLLDEPIGNEIYNTILERIKGSLEGLKLIDNQIDGHVKEESIRASLKSLAYSLQQFKKEIKPEMNRVELLNKLAFIIFNLK
jgi:hypothetical protein